MWAKRGETGSSENGLVRRNSSVGERRADHIDIKWNWHRNARRRTKRESARSQIPVDAVQCADREGARENRKQMSRLRETRWVSTIRKRLPQHAQNRVQKRGSIKDKRRRNPSVQTGKGSGKRLVKSRRGQDLWNRRGKVKNSRKAEIVGISDFSSRNNVKKKKEEKKKDSYIR